MNGEGQLFPGYNMYPDYRAGVGEMDPLSLYDSVFKALSVDGSLPRSGPSLNAAQVEDLSGTMASAEMKEKVLKFWKRLTKKKAISANGEWVRIDDYGDNGESGFIGASDAGFVGDPLFTRGNKLIKYMGVKGQVDFPTQLVELIGFNGRGVNAMNTAQVARMRHLLRLMERACFHGNDAVDSLEIDGVFAQIDSAADASNGIRYDMRGKFLDRYPLIHMSQIAANNNSDLTDFYLPNEGYLDLQQSLFPQIRTGDNIPDAAVGANFERLLIMTLGGDPDYCKIHRTQMLTNGVKGALPSGIPSRAGANAPDAPSAVTGTNVSHTATADQPGLAGGVYYFSIASVGKGGRSLATSISSAVTCAEGEAARLTIVGADEDIRYYEIYRNEEGVSGVSTANRKYMGRVKRTGSTMQWTDTGYALPNTYHCAALSMDEDETYVKQLLPPSKRALPQDLMANAFGILTFFALLMEVPTHNIHVVNVGKRLQSGIAGTGDAITGMGS